MSANGKRKRVNGAATPQKESSSSSQASTASEAESEEFDGPFVRLSAAEAYFQAHSKPTKTSDNRFSDHVDEPFTSATYLDALPEDAPVPLLEAYDARFSLWVAELEAGFSLCFVGQGSKKPLLQRFARRSLCRRGDVVSVNGYVPSLSFGDLLQAIEKDVLKGEGPAPSGEGDRTEQRVRAICEHFAADIEEDTKRPLFIVVHNIEGAALRSAKIRGLLAMMAATPRIHMLVTFDHFRAPLLFPTALVAGRPPYDTTDEEGDGGLIETRTFNFLFHHAPTRVPYTYEPLIAGLPSQLFDPAVFAPVTGKGAGRGTAAQRVAGAVSVLSSLGKDQHDLFVFLADQQCARKEATSFSRLQDRFQLINPERFDGLLRELYDHEVVEKQGEALKVLLSKEEMERVLDHAILAQAIERVKRDDECRAPIDADDSPFDSACSSNCRRNVAACPSSSVRAHGSELEHHRRSYPTPRCEAFLGVCPSPGSAFLKCK